MSQLHGDGWTCVDIEPLVKRLNTYEELKGLRLKLNTWCRDNALNTHGTSYNISSYIYEFRDYEDAVAFKLIAAI